MSGPTGLQKTAVHESAHAAVAVAGGFRLIGLHVSRGDRFKGACSIAHPPAPPRLAYLAYLRAGDVAVTLLNHGYPPPSTRVGSWYFDAALTERVYSGQSHEAGVRSDSDAAAPLRPAAGELEAADRRALEVLDRHWWAVTGLADVLLARGAIGGDVAEAILERRGLSGHVAAPRAVAPPGPGAYTCEPPAQRAPRTALERQRLLRSLGYVPASICDLAVNGQVQA